MDENLDVTSRENIPILAESYAEYETPGSDYINGTVGTSNLKSFYGQASNETARNYTYDQWRARKPNHVIAKLNSSAKYLDADFEPNENMCIKKNENQVPHTNSNWSCNHSIDGAFRTINSSQLCQRGVRIPKVTFQTFSRDYTVPVTKNSMSCSTLFRSNTNILHQTSNPLKLSFQGSSSSSSSSCTEQSSSTCLQVSSESEWTLPTIADQQYEKSKQKLLLMGKFREHMIKYFSQEKRNLKEKADSDDDGYDTDTDKQCGFDLIADDKSRKVLEDGVFPEYKQECRNFRSNPNSYFLRHCLDDNIRMRYRYFSKGDSITVSNHIKNHLTVSSLDLEDNSIGPVGMKYFKEVLLESKHLTDMNLSRNNLGPEGAKYLRTALQTNCYLLKLNISENGFGEKGGKYCARILEENVTLLELNISGNSIGDTGATLIGKALGGNISLKVLNVSWNNITEKGAIHLAGGIANNSELEVFRAAMNGFSDEGGKAIFNALRQNHVIKELDLSSNRINDAVMRFLTNNLDCISSLSDLNLANNRLKSKSVLQCLTALVASKNSLKHINLEGVVFEENTEGLRNILLEVHNITIDYKVIPSRREITTDVLTTNLTQLCEFMKKENIEVADIYPDYGDENNADNDGQVLITVKEALYAVECCGKVKQLDRLQKLRSRLQYDRKRKFSISEFSKIYDTVVRGKDPLREQPLRTHLRRSIREEREAKERKSKQKRGNRKNVKSAI